ncbi:MAG: D-glycero-beta-D-manno-heptose-7-phosphate kinase, partial [Candidatus Margulisbacteria bacterium]|nr:D-glycero-beta-D-manno-heptose-7-phosphate kinase [Candidatus Margulisiibacteriota bacterium]
MNSTDLHFSNQTILIIGDVMLDQYYDTDIDRISPEAPVPVAKVKNTTYTLGGAANVAENVSELTANAILIGGVGNDPNKTTLESLLKKKKIVSHFIEWDGPTINKIRVVSGQQQIVRLDIEEKVILTSDTQKKLKNIISTQLPKADVVILSDYGKGICDPDICQFVISTAKTHSTPVFVDPKGIQWEKYTGATCITPNLKELSAISQSPIAKDDEIIESQAKSILKQFKTQYILVTRSEKGMSLVSQKETIHMPTDVKDVFDVSGAGDTVTAVLSVCIGCGLKLKDALHIANTAAGIVVSKRGTTAISYSDLIFALKNKNGNKVIPKKLLTAIIESHKKENRSIVFTNGCFDILHSGHISYLKQAKELGDILIVGLNSDDSIKRIK